jgi:AmmeMemoRadiSam system protein B
MKAIRQPAVAGYFYPSGTRELGAMVDRVLAEPSGVDAASALPPKAIIAPHAGYIYSGPVAARAFAMLASGRGSIRRVVVIGPAHYAWFEGIAAPSSPAFQTPLGVLPVDRSAIEKLHGLPSVQIADSAHVREHALEVQLPFLQRTLGEVQIVPLLVGDARPEDVAAFLARVWGGEENAIVVSSDLSHYHDADTARRRDAATADEIERSDGSKIGPDDACGFLPIAGLLLETRARGLRARRLDLRNSGDTAGSKDRVVGYGAWSFAASPRTSAVDLSAAGTLGGDRPHSAM